MQRLYETYRDIAEFRMVYINEAHAADSKWAVDYAGEKELFEHKDFGQRCTSAKTLLSDKNLTIPCVVDNMENTTNLAYSAWPDRIFIVRTDGLLAVAANEGPFGFVPALKETEAWLEAFAKTGEEPTIGAWEWAGNDLPGQVASGQPPHLPTPVIHHRLPDFPLRVHHERPLSHDRLVNRLAAQQQRGRPGRVVNAHQ